MKDLCGLSFKNTTFSNPFKKFSLLKFMADDISGEKMNPEIDISQIKKEPHFDSYHFTEPVYHFENKTIVISTSTSIKSLIHSIIICDRFIVNAEKVKISGFHFECMVSFSGCSDVLLSDCTIANTNPEFAAIQIVNSKAILIKNVEIMLSSSPKGGIILEDSFAMLEKVTIRDLLYTLLTIYDSCVEIKNCVFDGSYQNGIVVESSKVKMQNSVIANINQTGIYLTSLKDAIIESNKLHDIQGVAILLLSESKATISKNEFSNILGSAIGVAQMSAVMVEENIASDIGTPVFWLFNDCEGVYQNNKITKTERLGICSRGATKITIKGNDLTDIKECAISIADTKTAIVSNNTIQNTSIAAIEVYNKSFCDINSNRMNDVGDYGISVFAGSKINALNNFIHGAKRAVIQMKYKGCGRLIGNKTQNCLKLVDGPTTGLFYFKNNSPFKNLTNNISLRGNGINFEKTYIDSKDKLCMKCLKNPRNCFFSNCGHKIYCEECATEFLKGNDKCPLCRCHIDKITTGFMTSDDNNCFLCFLRPSSCIILPCGHMGFCSDCMKKWFATNQSCPYCREEFAYYKPIIHDI
ncbi:hypothetical protein TRFO_17109 [Tritrichomonas foetus]|uniref:RING-type domain-containing protein n=1 Tax=Tritrichomonas foetus TaxID=1144522 RepID=A0A1J4KNG7_9EUKA|nr:hypothetical protein TRFO_17109 [Tritrichomonas foetus]|eukprot:OHT12857.1 hypothetical protein TRFO_17109 [Tritrichomonas foetus]